MNSICLMKNTIQTYAWGSRTALSELMGESTPSQQPQAELWMGAHPKAPSKIWFQERWQALDLLIAEYPAEILGAKVGKRFDHRMPFLLKVLAADQPLSIQAHPNKIQASAGFRRENAASVALDAPHRNYKDDQHKPECLYALSSFWGMCGFRTMPDMLGLLGPVWPSQHNHALTLLTRQGIPSFFQYLMTMEKKYQGQLVESVVQKIAQNNGGDHVATWIQRLVQSYGHDIGVLSPILLNLIELKPGQAIFLPAGQLHAYLEGVGIELMANSDNVLRGGLTSKHVDPHELLNVLDFKPHKPDISAGLNHHKGELIFPSQADEFILSLIQLAKDEPIFVAEASDVPEILLCSHGTAMIYWQNGAQVLELPKGQSAFVPASVARYTISGDATLFRASVNL